ncbi:MAG TPA: hypothetical protein VN222_10580 [Novosphingobium sp.]|nr:hypothetical protein [Novosphingobium sp.]
MITLLMAVTATVAAVPAEVPAAPATVVQETAPAAPEFQALVLPPNTELVVTPNDSLTTKSAKVGDKFKLSTVFDVMQNGVVLIPRGTMGEGTVMYRTGTGAFGKSGKMEVAFNTLTLNGRQIPLTGKHRQEGEGNTGAAVGAVVAVGVLGAFVKGHSAAIPNGQQMRAYTAEPLTFNVPANAARVTTGTLAAVTVASPVATPVAQPAK